MKRRGARMEKPRRNGGGVEAERPIVLVYLMLPPEGEPRGGARSMLLTARHLARYEPIFVLNRPSALEDDAQAAGLRTMRLTAPRVLDGLRAASWSERFGRLRTLVLHDLALLRIARETGAEILHCQDPAEVLTAGIAARLSGRSVVFHMRDGPRKRHLRLPKILAAAVASRCICVSDAIRESYIGAAPPALRGWIARRMVAIPNGIERAAVDRERATLNREQARDLIGVGPKDFVLTVVGPLSRKKNQLELLEKSGKELVSLGPDVRLVFVGSEGTEPEYARKCRQAAASLGVPERISFVGELPHEMMGRVYAATDVLLIPSAVEGLPRVALEAQAWSCPIVASRIPANEAAIVEGETGLLVDRDRLERFAEPVRSLRDPTARIRMGEAGRAHVLRNFDVVAVTPRIEDVYDDLLE